MAKRKRQITQRVIERYIKEGRGQGKGDKYIPWIKIHDVASLGRATRIKGWKTGRIHHLLSDLETSFFYMLEFNDDVIDIREQFPLDLEETIDIADELGIRHPIDPFTRHPIVMTTDFLVDINKGIDKKNTVLARTVKYSNELEKLRVMEKFEIERCYWNKRDIDWGIVTEKQINKDFVKNIKWIHKRLSLDGVIDISNDELVYIEEVIRYEVIKSEDNISNIAKEVDIKLNIDTGTTLAIVRFFLANKIWKVDMTEDILYSKHFKILNINELDQRGRSVIGI